MRVLANAAALAQMWGDFEPARFAVQSRNGEGARWVSSREKPAPTVIALMAQN